MESTIPIRLEKRLAACQDAIPLPLADVAVRTDYHAEHLGRLIRKGRLPTVTHGKRWFASVEAVEQYQQSIEEKVI